MITKELVENKNSKWPFSHFKDFIEIKVSHVPNLWVGITKFTRKSPHKVLHNAICNFQVKALHIVNLKKPWAHPMDPFIAFFCKFSKIDNFIYPCDQYLSSAGESIGSHKKL